MVPHPAVLCAVIINTAMQGPVNVQAVTATMATVAQPQQHTQVSHRARLPVPQENMWQKKMPPARTWVMDTIAAEQKLSAREIKVPEMNVRDWGDSIQTRTVDAMPVQIALVIQPQETLSKPQNPDRQNAPKVDTAKVM